MDMSLSKLWKMVKDREVWCAAAHGVTNSWAWLSDWAQQSTSLNWYQLLRWWWLREGNTFWMGNELFCFRHVKFDKRRQHIQKQRHYFANKDPSSQGYGFFSGHVWMWELDCEESWALNNWCFWTVELKKTLESIGLQRDLTSSS